MGWGVILLLVLARDFDSYLIYGMYCAVEVPYDSYTRGF